MSRLYSPFFKYLKYMIKLLITVFLIFCQNMAFAAPIKCLKIKDNNARLACFDRQINVRQSTNKPDHLSDLKRSPSRSKDFSLLNQRWELEKDQIQFAFRAYKPVYFLPIFYSTSPNELPQTSNPRTTLNDPLNLNYLESKLQLSFKTKLLNNIFDNNGDLWFGYTQSSRWQIYNGDESRPFRETNHEPEFMLVFHASYDLWGFDGRMLSLSLNHQSNGQKEPLSRSWNRLIFTFGLDKQDWVLMFRPWLRIPESSASEDENPDIEDFIGRGEILIVHKRDEHQISTQLRHSLNVNKPNGSIKIEWSYPCFDRLRCHAQIFRGYGESLIDYNHQTTMFGIGVALVEWY